MSETQLKTRKIHGRDYVEVNERLKYFRRNYPDYSIRTKVLHLQGDEVVMSATILDDEGRILSVGHAQEDKTSSQINRTSYVENCETSAIGRALGIFGIGLDGGVATAEEVEMAIAKQEAKPHKPKLESSTAPDPASEVVEQSFIDLFAPHAALINPYLVHIGWITQGMSVTDLPTDKLQYCADNLDSLIQQAKRHSLQTSANVRSAVAKSAGKGGAA